MPRKKLKPTKLEYPELVAVGLERKNPRVWAFTRKGTAETEELEKLRRMVKAELHELRESRKRESELGRRELLPRSRMGASRDRIRELERMLAHQSAFFIKDFSKEELEVREHLMATGMKKHIWKPIQELTPDKRKPRVLALFGREGYYSLAELYQMAKKSRKWEEVFRLEKGKIITAMKELTAKMHARNVGRFVRAINVWGVNEKGEVILLNLEAAHLFREAPRNKEQFLSHFRGDILKVASEIQLLLNMENRRQNLIYCVDAVLSVHQKHKINTFGIQPTELVDWNE